MPLEHAAFLAQIEPFRHELKAHCYRMAGSLADAEDLTQDSLLKAWRAFDTFQGRSSLRHWLYTVATRTCLDALDSKQGRILLSGPPGDPTQPPGPPDEGVGFIDPYPDAQLPGLEQGPEARYTQRESVALAFLAALQLLPAKQRAVLLLRDVLGWQASEVAALIDTSVPAVNSALQRARETLEQHAPATPAMLPDDVALRAMLGRYMQAWEASDPAAFVALLHEDAIASMPPLRLWLSGRDAIGELMRRFVWPMGRFTFKPTWANAAPALAVWLDGRPAALHVLTVRDGRVTRLDAFLRPELVSHFPV